MYHQRLLVGWLQQQHLLMLHGSAEAADCQLTLAEALVGGSKGGCRSWHVLCPGHRVPVGQLGGCRPPGSLGQGVQRGPEGSTGLSQGLEGPEAELLGHQVQQELVHACVACQGEPDRDCSMAARPQQPAASHEPHLDAWGLDRQAARTSGVHQW